MNYRTATDRVRTQTRSRKELVANGREEPAGSIPLLLTSAEVAEALKIAPSTLCHWRARGRGPRVFWIGPATPRYRREDVLAWLERIGS